ncbi:MAG: M1 family aminopeptidase, partial [Gemmatimonadota bacterium]
VERLRQSESSDDRVRVVAHEGTHAATAQSPDGRLVWQFRADSVRDVAFSVTRNHAWDAARTPVGDRDGDGVTDYTRVDAFWRSYSRYYDEAWRYAQHSIAFLSAYTGLPYAWPHMTVVEGGGIIGGGMEYPMMTLIGDYNRAGADPLYNVTAHELAHMWLPMMASVNERRFAWLDEGTTTFLENNARADFFPGADPYGGEQRGYLSTAASGMEGPMMRWSDFHRPGPAYGTASYAKPASVLHALRGVLGEETFTRALRTFFDRWAFKHPYPWDFFNTFEDVSGRDLDWFWRSWYYESAADGERWYLDQSVEAVERLESGETRVTVRDLGWVPMPAVLTITRSDGTTLERTVPVDRWLEGADRATVT